jgi:exopolysaccharide production protein ExoQ
MDSNRHPLEQPSIAARVSRAAFCVYVVFMLVGSVMPFTDHESADSNLINKVMDSVIPFICFLCLWPKRKAIMSILWKEKYLAVLLAWCTISVFWSDFRFSSMKASIRVIGSTIVILAFLANARTSSDALKYIRAVLAIYILASLVAIAFIPGATMPDSDAWRGLTSHKNTLGGISLISAVAWAAAMAGSSAGKKMLAGFFLAASLVLVWGSQSATSLVILAVVAFLGLCVWVNRRLGRIALVPTIACCGAFVVLFSNVNASGALIDWLGKDNTLTGRTDLWSALGDEIRTHPIIGSGFNGFWLADNRSVQVIQTHLEWGPMEGHEGYLDLFNEVGVIGLLLLALVVIRYFRNMQKNTVLPVWAWLVIGLLFLNLMESEMLRAGSFASWVFILAYFATYSDFLNQNRYIRKGVAA